MDDLTKLNVGDIISESIPEWAEGSFIGTKAIVTHVSPPLRPHDTGSFGWLTLEVDPNDKSGYTTAGAFGLGHLHHPDTPQVRDREAEITLLDHSAFYADLLTNHNRYEVGDGVQCNHGEHAGKRGVVTAYQQPHVLDHQEEMRAEPINQGTGWVLWETGTDTILSILYHPMTPNFGLLDEAPVKTGSTFKSIGLSHGREQPGNWGLFVEVFDFDEGEMVSVTLPGGKALGVVTRETTEHWDDGLCEWHPLKTRRYEIKLLHVEVLGGSWKAGDAIQQNAIRWFHPAFNEQYGIRSLDLVLDTDEWNLTQGGA